MPKPAVLVIDIGTSVLKTTLFDYRCRVLDRVERPHPNLDNGQAAEAWWNAAAESIRQLVRRHREYRVEVIGLTGFMHEVVAVDQMGKPIAFDPEPRHVRFSYKTLIERFGVRQLYNLTGSRMDPTSVPPRLAAWCRTDAASFETIRQILPVKDFLRYRLTGTFATDPIDAVGTMLCDLHRRQWDTGLLAWCELDPAQLPPVVPCTDLAGNLTATAAAALQLATGTPVSVGGGDDIEILGCGARGPCELCEHLGTTGSLLVAATEPREDPRMRLELYPGVCAGDWIIGASCSNVARAFDWFLQLSTYSSNGTIDWPRVQSDLDSAVRRLDSSSPMFLPYLTGERAPLWEPDLSASWHGLRSSHGQPELLASVVEGICFSLRSLFDAFAPLGLNIDTVFSSGRLEPAGHAGTSRLHLRPADALRGRR